MNTERPLRILHVVGGMNRGGTETLLMHFLRHIDRARYRMDFLVHTTQPGAYDAEARRLGSRILPCLAPGRPWTYARNFRRILRTHGPYDIVHTHVHWFSGLPLWIAARAGVPGRIMHAHPLADLERPTRRRQAYRRVATALIARAATQIVAASHGTLAGFQAIRRFPQPASVLYAGIDLAPFARPIDRAAVRQRLGLPLDRPVIAYVARFVPHKNHAQLLRVAARLNEGEGVAHFAVAGSHGPLLGYLQDQGRRRRDLSVLVGLPDVSELLLAADIFFFPSLEEGFGIVAVEAAAAGLPIVATDLPPIREACPPGHHAFMMPPDDDDRALSHLRRLLNDPTLRATLAADARAWAPNFSIARSVARLQAIYDHYRPYTALQRNERRSSTPHLKIK